MKTIFTFISVLIFSFNQAQSYQPMLIPDNNWTVTIFARSLEGPDYLSDSNFKFTGNTVLREGESYLELTYRQSNDYHDENGSPTSWSEWEIADFYLMEAPTEKKVWIYYDEENVHDHQPGKFLLYDFNLEVGDYIPVSGYLYSDEYSITPQITDITYDYIYLDGVDYPVRIFSFDYSNQAEIPFLLYEGIGSSHGIVHFNLTWDVGTELTGFNTVLTTNEVESSDIRVYPNPAKDKVKINSKTPIVSVDILDLNGRSLKQINYSNEINIEDLIQGNYFLKIKTEDGLYHIHRLIKK